MHSDKKKISFLQFQLLDWYKANGRRFPWRNKSATNYIKIISEVLLQRTRAETVAKYFPLFFRNYPSWNKLGGATQSELKQALKSLGLQNQRASRLFKLAQEMKHRNGRFPSTRNQVEEMPMMGQYITNAYELFILNRPSPLLDVNMSRVLERFFSPRKLADIRYDPNLQKLATIVVNVSDAKKINWAILDFGALICRPKIPKCGNCILRTKCNFFRLVNPL